MQFNFLLCLSAGFFGLFKLFCILTTCPAWTAMHAVLNRSLMTLSETD